jgi:hypothetical protein
MELVISDDLCEMTSGTTDGIYNKDCIADYLNNKLYTDPEFFGDFGPENIVSIQEIE